MDNDSITNKQINDIKDVDALQKEELSKLKNDVYGNDIDISALTKATNSITDLFKRMDQFSGGDMVSAMEKMSASMSSAEKQSLEKIKKSIQDNKDPASLQSLLFNSENGNITKYEDLMIVTNIIPQLVEAKNAFRDSILSPDDFTKQLSLNYFLDGVAMTEENKNFSQIKNILNKKYKFTKNIKEITDGMITFGKHYTAVLPYSKIFARRLRKKKEQEGLLGKLTENATYDDQKQITTLLENVLPKSDIDSIHKTEFDNGYRFSNLEKEKIFIEKIDSVKFSESTDLVDLEMLIEAKKYEGKSGEDFVKYAQTIIKQNKDSYSSGSYNSTKSNNIDSDGFVQTDDKLEEIDVKGAYIRQLDIRNLLPIKINDVCLGYYYIENINDLNIIRNPNRFRLRAANMINSKRNNDESNNIETIYKSLSDLLIKRMDKKFIEQNAEIKSQLYDIIRYNDFINGDIQVTFFEPDEVQEFEMNGGKSIFEQSLFFSKLYLALLMSTLMMKISRSNDIRAYYVETDPQGGVSSIVNNAIVDIKKNQRNLSSLSNVTNILKQFTTFDDIFLSKNNNDRKPIDFDIIQGQSIDGNNDLLDNLLQIIVDSTGCPLALISNSNEVDFAKTYTMLNIKFLKRVVNYQADMNNPLSEFIIKILKTELSEDVMKEIDGLAVALQSPINLTLVNLLDQINNLRDLGGAMATLVLGDNNPDNTLRDAFILEVCKTTSGNIDFQSYINTAEKLKMQLKTNKLSNPGSDEDMSV